MDLTELTQSRRTIHNFKPEPVAESLVEEALRLSLWAPNHRTTWPWAYIWVGPVVRAQLIDLAIELKSKKGELTEAKKLALKSALNHPAHMICLGVKRAEEPQMHEDYATLACSVQIASMFLWDKGIGTKWSTGGFSTHDKAYCIMGVDPEEVKLEGALLIGIPAILPESVERPELKAHLISTT